jgi:multidrug efflux system membrane fusion protein
LLAQAKIAPTSHPSVPVSIAVATRQNVPVYLIGLGTVQASLTVGIRPQVDGTLQEVLFTEGQDVKRATCWPKLIRGYSKQRFTRRPQKRPKTRH